MFFGKVDEYAGCFYVGVHSICARCTHCKLHGRIWNLPLQRQTKIPTHTSEPGCVLFQSAKHAFSALAISSTKRCGLLALRRASTRSRRLKRFTSRAKICRCRLSLPGGTAIINTRSTGSPSGAPQSTPCRSSSAEMPGADTPRVAGVGQRNAAADGRCTAEGLALADGVIVGVAVRDDADALLQFHKDAQRVG